MSTYVTSVNNLSNLPYLGSLNLVVNHITSIDVLGCENLTQFYITNNHLTSLDISNNNSLSEINIGNNPNITNLYFGSLPFCIYFSAYGCSLPTEIIDDILVKLSNNSNSGGYCFLDGGSNGVPTSTGISAANYLTGDAGWTVTYNT